MTAARRKRSASSLATPAIPSGRIEERILLIRGRRVMLDRDLAEIYGVTTKRLNEQVKRNRGRFPDDFMFSLTMSETKSIAALRSQIATLKRGQHFKRAPNAFSEHGAVMLASVLNSPIAVQASIAVVRAFVRLREILAAHKTLANKLNALERKYDSQFRVVFDAIRKLMRPPDPQPRCRIGFIAAETLSLPRGQVERDCDVAAQVTARVAAGVPANLGGISKSITRRKVISRKCIAPIR